MITADRSSLIAQDALFGESRHGKLSLTGLSTDTKPIGNFNGIKLDNGSSFMELDTQNVFFYDEENETWEG